MSQSVINPLLCKFTNRIRLNLLVFGHAVVGHEWKGRVSSPSYSRLYYCMRGVSFITANNVRIQLTPGKWYLLPAGCTFDYECIEEMEQLYFHLKLCDFDEIDLLRNCTNPICFDFPAADHNFLVKCTRSSNITDGLKVRQRIYEILLWAIEKYNINIQSDDYSPCVFAAITYIKHNLSMQLTISEIAENIFVSKSTLTKHFKKELGVSVNEYIFDIIMLEAEHLLLTTTMSILAISEKFGFSDQFYFSRRFKENFGTPPREYRKKMML